MNAYWKKLKPTMNLFTDTVADSDFHDITDGNIDEEMLIAVSGETDLNKVISFLPQPVSGFYSRFKPSRCVWIVPFNRWPTSVIFFKACSDSHLTAAVCTVCATSGRACHLYARCPSLTLDLETWRAPGPSLDLSSCIFLITPSWTSHPSRTWTASR
jgi:hypothetical protein